MPELRRALPKSTSALVALLVFAVLDLAGGAALGLGLGHVVHPNASPSLTPTASAVPGTVAELMTTHQCWTGPGDIPADMKQQIPGHVVLTTAAGRAVYGGPTWVHKALEQQFNGQDYRLEIAGFCR